MSTLTDFIFIGETQIEVKLAVNQEELQKLELENENKPKPDQEEHDQGGAEDDVEQQDKHHEAPQVDNMRYYPLTRDIDRRVRITPLGILMLT